MNLDQWIPDSKHSKIKPTKGFTKDDLIHELSLIQSKGWITLARNRQGKDGGLGNTLEDLLCIRENNIPLADYGDHELKTHRSGSDSLLSMFRLEPYPRSKQQAIIPSLLKNYGWPLPEYGPRELSLRVDMDGAAFSERGFGVKIDEQLQRIELHFDSNKVPSTSEYQLWLQDVKRRIGLGDMNPIPYWTFEVLEKKLRLKIRNMVYITVDELVEGGRQKMRISKAILLQEPKLDKFLDAIRNGWVQIEFNARTHHNHGTAFRTWERNWPKLYGRAEILLRSAS